MVKNSCIMRVYFFILFPACSAAVITKASVPLSSGLSIEHLSCGSAANPANPPVLFVHGTFHGAWCWEQNWLARFAAAGIACHAVSLRGTSGSPVVDQKSVKITEHVQDLRAFVETVLPSTPPVLVGHSFGGASVLKYLEAGHPAAGAVLLCAVPPSGNGPMVGRFLRRSLKQAWLITTGFAMKKAATEAQVCRDLFFDPEEDGLETVVPYLPLLEADSKVGL